ncbi:hypothetical protein SKTS_19330 [Sulfurimicrobium lacus]|uniref:Uncharacterized protein n=1 Tax=Sulfurimicrobium lacus TaxID=2715678 RepID=A0A6F8VD69_9PROT|nr:hypothetical protein [Sulfurimicrobium lacus]BCB27047.1 hypothetical protein SKTS_19330 [Sulfurimicrobium lacus]
MTGLALAESRLPAMSDDAIDKVRSLEAAMRGMPQVAPRTEHLIHGGMYARTIRIPAGAVLTGAFIKLATVLIVNGECTVFTGGDTLELRGYHVIPASAGRKQVFIAHVDTDLTMLFPSSAASVEQAEAEFTDEYPMLLSRQIAEQDSIIITGE